jgi:hypothetical protein
MAEQQQGEWVAADRAAEDDAADAAYVREDIRRTLDDFDSDVSRAETVFPPSFSRLAKLCVVQACEALGLGCMEVVDSTATGSAVHTAQYVWKPEFASAAHAPAPSPERIGPAAAPAAVALALGHPDPQYMRDLAAMEHGGVGCGTTAIIMTVGALQDAVDAMRRAGCVALSVHPSDPSAVQAAVDGFGLSWRSGAGATDCAAAYVPFGYRLQALCDETAGGAGAAGGGGGGAAGVGVGVGVGAGVGGALARARSPEAAAEARMDALAQQLQPLAQQLQPRCESASKGKTRHRGRHHERAADHSTARPRR